MNEPISNIRCVRNVCIEKTAASDKAYQLLVHGRWFSPGTPASSTTKTGRHDIAEILLKVTLNPQKIYQSINQSINLENNFEGIINSLPRNSSFFSCISIVFQVSIHICLLAWVSAFFEYISMHISMCSLNNSTSLMTRLFQSSWPLIVLL